MLADSVGSVQQRTGKTSSQGYTYTYVASQAQTKCSNIVQKVPDEAEAVISRGAARAAARLSPQLYVHNICVAPNAPEQCIYSTYASAPGHKG